MPKMYAARRSSASSGHPANPERALYRPVASGYNCSNIGCFIGHGDRIMLYRPAYRPGPPSDGSKADGRASRRRLGIPGESPSGGGLMADRFIAFEVADVRFPTSRELDGSDAMN